MTTPKLSETHYFRFEHGTTRGTVVALKFDDGTAEGRAVFDGRQDGALTYGLDEWIDPERVARIAVMSAIQRALYEPDWRYFDAVQLRSQANDLSPGEYYPRIWRPRHDWALPDERAARTDSKVALRRLEETTRDVFGIVEPQHHLSAFGHRIREILILASMEFENACRSVLAANHYQFPKWASTNDYVQLLDPLRLHDCVLELVEYPTMTWFKPFENWQPTSPTDSLAWYDAYNQTKHSRTDAFADATLEAALNALAAAWALHGMQFGPGVVAEDSAMFRLRPISFSTEYGYVCLIMGDAGTAVDFPF